MKFNLKIKKTPDNQPDVNDIENSNLILVFPFSFKFLSYFIFGGIISGFVEFCSGYFLRQKFLVNKIPFMRMRVPVIFTVMKIFHEFGRRVSEMQRNR